jgi:hypothetical protein
MKNPKYGGLLAHIFEAADLQTELGCSADEAYAMIDATNAVAEEPETVGNIIYNVPFGKGRRKDEKTIGAL